MPTKTKAHIRTELATQTAFRGGSCERVYGFRKENGMGDHSDFSKPSPIPMRKMSIINSAPVPMT
jgi:hypothetical protein